MRTGAIFDSLPKRFPHWTIDWYVHTYDEAGFSANGVDSSQWQTRGYLADSSPNKLLPSTLGAAAWVSESTEDVQELISPLVRRLHKRNAFDQPKNVVAMWRKRWLCKQLRLSASATHGPYDAVLITRPDVCWMRPRFTTPLDFRVPVLPLEYSFGTTSDVSALGTVDFADYYSDLFQNIEDIHHRLGGDVNPHALLGEWLAGIETRQKMLGISLRRRKNDPPPHPGMNRWGILRHQVLYSNWPSTGKL